MIWGRRLYRFILIAVILILLTLNLPHPVTAAPARAVELSFKVVGVKAKESVTIRTVNFPLRTQFVVLMDVIGRQGIGGQQVGEFNSADGGAIEKTFNIPASLRSEIIMALRIESSDGYYAYNWFFNENMAYKPANPEKVKPELAFSDIQKNTSVHVSGQNLPANTTFSVRVGPYYTFYRDYVFTQDVVSDSAGKLDLNLDLPKNVKDSDYIMLRLDGAGVYVYNNFQNVDGGKAMTDSQLYKVIDCQVIAINPIPALEPGEQFDVVWTVQNTGLEDWNNRWVIYRFIDGEHMHKYDNTKTLPWTIKRGQVFDFAIDMIAPQQTGWHSTTWMVMQVAHGNRDLCRLKVSVFVK